MLQESQLGFRKSCGCLRDNLKVGNVYNGRKLLEKNVKDHRHKWECIDCGFQQLAQTAKIKKQKTGCRCKRAIQTLSAEGKTYTIREASKVLGISDATIRNRMKTGWTDRQVLGIDARPRDLKARGEKGLSFKQLCEKNGVSVSTARSRKALGWSTLEACGEAKRKGS